MTSHTAEAGARSPRAGLGRPRPPRGSSWGVPVTLVGLSFIPVTAGVLRIVEIYGGPQLLPNNSRLDASPAPFVIHLVAAATYALVGAFQFSARLRRRHPGWHRTAGRMLVGAGLVVAITGLWITLLHPDAPGGAWLWAIRLVVATAMGASLVAGLSAIRRRDIAAHRGWMIRAYALAVGAGTQVFTETLGEATLGTNDMSKAVSLTAGWIINAVVAEWVIRRPARPHRERWRQGTRPARREPDHTSRTGPRTSAEPPYVHDFSGLRMSRAFALLWVDRLGRCAARSHGDVRDQLVSGMPRAASEVLAEPSGVAVVEDEVGEVVEAVGAVAEHVGVETSEVEGGALPSTTRVAQLDDVSFAERVADGLGRQAEVAGYLAAGIGGVQEGQLLDRGDGDGEVPPATRGDGSVWWEGGVDGDR